MTLHDIPAVSRSGPAVTTPSACADGFCRNARPKGPRWRGKAQSEPQNVPCSVVGAAVSGAAEVNAALEKADLHHDAWLHERARANAQEDRAAAYAKRAETMQQMCHAASDRAAIAEDHVAQLEQALRTIEQLTNAPHWDTARRYRIGEIARDALLALVAARGGAGSEGV